MKFSPEILPLSRPLRDARLVTGTSPRDAEESLQERERAAYERGRREGEKALSEQLLRQRAELLDLQNGVLNALRRTFPEVARECENTLVALALEAAQKLVAGLPISQEMIETTVREALAQVEETNSFTILLHPEDFELLQRANSPLLLSDVGGERMVFQASNEITRGGCLVRTKFGTVDARRETKLGLLKKSLDL